MSSQFKASELGTAERLAAARPHYRNIHVTQIVRYRMPPGAIVSVLHRISGALLFLALPFLVWMFDTSVTSEVSYERFAALFRSGAGPMPGAFYKLVALVLIWAYLHHIVAGVRHLWMDATHAVTQGFGQKSALATLAVSLLLTVLLGWKLFT